MAPIELESFTVEKIIGFRLGSIINDPDDGSYDSTLDKVVHLVQYLVKWDGYPDPSENTWEPKISFASWSSDYEMSINQLLVDNPDLVHPSLLEEEADRLNEIERQNKLMKKKKGRGKGKGVKNSVKSSKPIPKSYSFHQQSSLSVASTSMNRQVARSTQNSAVSNYELQEYFDHRPTQLDGIKSNSDLKSLLPDRPPRRNKKGELISSSEGEGEEGHSSRIVGKGKESEVVVHDEHVIEDNDDDDVENPRKKKKLGRGKYKRVRVASESDEGFADDVPEVKLPSIRTNQRKKRGIVMENKEERGESPVEDNSRRLVRGRRQQKTRTRERKEVETIVVAEAEAEPVGFAVEDVEEELQEFTARRERAHLQKIKREELSANEETGFADEEEEDEDVKDIAHFPNSAIQPSLVLPSPIPVSYPSNRNLQAMKTREQGVVASTEVADKQAKLEVDSDDGFVDDDDDEDDAVKFIPPPIEKAPVVSETSAVPLPPPPKPKSLSKTPLPPPPPKPVAKVVPPFPPPPPKPSSSKSTPLPPATPRPTSVLPERSRPVLATSSSTSNPRNAFSNNRISGNNDPASDDDTGFADEDDSDGGEVSSNFADEEEGSIQSKNSKNGKNVTGAASLGSNNQGSKFIKSEPGLGNGITSAQLVKLQGIKIPKKKIASTSSSTFATCPSTSAVSTRITGSIQTSRLPPPPPPPPVPSSASGINPLPHPRLNPPSASISTLAPTRATLLPPPPPRPASFNPSVNNVANRNLQPAVAPRFITPSTQSDQLPPARGRAIPFYRDRPPTPPHPPPSGHPSPYYQYRSHPANGSRPKDPFNNGVERRESKDGYIILKADVIHQKFTQTDLGRKIYSEYKNVVSTEEEIGLDTIARIKKFWKIGNPALNFFNLEATMGSKTLNAKECWIYAPLKDSKEFLKKKKVSDDHLALQLLLAAMNVGTGKDCEIRLTETLRGATRAVFIHASEMSKIGKSEELKELERYRATKGMVFVIFGGEDPEFMFLQFWNPIATLAISPEAFVADPTNMKGFIETGRDSVRNFHHRDIFPWAPLNYLTKVGRFGASFGEEWTRKKSSSDFPAIKAFHEAIASDSLCLVHPFRETEDSDKRYFPGPNDMEDYAIEAFVALEAYLDILGPQKHSDVEYLQLQVQRLKPKYLHIRRWIILGTAEEVDSVPEIPGIEVMTEAEVQRWLLLPREEL